MRKWRQAAILLPALAILCCVGPSYHTRVHEFISFDEAYDTLRLEEPPLFWIEHPELDSLLSQVFTRNPDLLTAWARVEQSRAAAGIATSRLIPSLSAGGSVSRSKTTGFLGQSQGGGIPIPGFTVDEAQHISDYRASLAASYEVDLFGRLFRRRRAAVQEANAAQADARSMGITLAARMIDTWLMTTAQRQTIILLEKQREASLRFLELTRLRFSQGQTTALDVIQQRQQVQTVEGQLAIARGRAATLDHQLMVLLGRLPGDTMASAADSLPAIPDLAVAGVPSDLFSHRPDVESAWLRLRAADERAAAAVLDLLPSLELSGNLFVSARQIGDLFDDWLWTLSGNVSQPLFLGGRLVSSKRQAEASAQIQYYDYINTALTALREVRDGIVLIRGQEGYLQSLREQAEAAERALRLARQRYAQGVLPYLQVLTLLRSFQRVEQSLVEARRQLLSYHVQLYRAVGGRFADDNFARREEISGG